jgi:nucleotide sugar dehydrogenase
MVKKDKTISIIGVGRLGLCFALNLEKSGYDVIGVDINEEYVNSLNNKTFFSFEKDVNDYLKKSQNFRATTSLQDALNHSNILIIAVRTTSLEDGRYDCSQVENVIREIEKIGKHKNTKYLIINCNVNPGYSDELQNRLDKYNYKINYNPEWVAQGTILYNQSYPDLVVIGENDKKSGDLIECIYNDICENSPPIYRMNRLSAEITKICLNNTLTMKITMANFIGDIAIKSGVDPNIILKAIGEDTRINSKFFKYGFGYGGP